MQKTWIFPDHPAGSHVDDLVAELNVPQVIAEILVNRDINTSADAKHYFRPKLRDLCDPFLMKTMDVAVDRIQEALKNRENILIYGDYDVDGITACSLLYLYLKALTNRVGFLIPERLKEGYGFSCRGVDVAKQRGVSLIITVDCGITSVSEVQEARNSGMDVIVTDHHQPGKILPDATAILNPMQEDCPYPFKGLAGVGVAFKLVHALDQTFGRDLSGLIKYTDLVAIGSSADVVPLVGENRILVRAGIERINERHNVGLNALLSVAQLKSTFIGTGQILFGIAPRINAAGRLGDAERGVKLFSAASLPQAMKIAQILERENSQRKNIEETIYQEAVVAAEEEFDKDSNDPLVLFGEGWHPGVIGIVASRLVDKFFRPVVMIAVSDGIGKGSIRSVPDFDVYTALNSCGDCLLGYGGHKFAAGLTIEDKQIPAFKEEFTQAVRKTLTPETLIPKLNIDARLTLDQINERLYTILKHFAPFGPQNSRPLFVVENAELAGIPHIVGKNHLKVSVRQNGTTVPAIGFNMGHWADKLEASDSTIDIAFVIDENIWRGTTTLQMQIKDIRIP